VSEEQITALIQGIQRQSLLIADAVLDFPVTQEDLHRVYKEVGRHYMLMLMTEEDAPTVGDWLEFAYGEEAGAE
jgi:hypothetical protein